MLRITRVDSSATDSIIVDKNDANDGVGNNKVDGVNVDTKIAKL